MTMEFMQNLNDEERLKARKFHRREMFRRFLAG